MHVSRSNLLAHCPPYTTFALASQYPHLLLPHRIKFAIKNVSATLEGKPLVIYAQDDETAQEYLKLSQAIYEKQ
jgi:hypothetical protein